MKYDVLNRFTGKVQFTADIECKEDDLTILKLRLAVEWALKNKTNLRGVDLRWVDLSGVDLRWVDLSEANLREADLREADLREANLSGANLSGANLRGANLRGANLRWADLSEANLSGANLSGANLRGANLRGAQNAIMPVTIGCVGENVRTGYALWDAVKKEVFVTLGCFSGTEKEAIAAVSNKYGARSGYALMVKAACKIAKERKVLNPTEETK